MVNKNDNGHLVGGVGKYIIPNSGLEAEALAVKKGIWLVQQAKCHSPHQSGRYCSHRPIQSHCFVPKKKKSYMLKKYEHLHTQLEF